MRFLSLGKGKKEVHATYMTKKNINYTTKFISHAEWEIHFLQEGNTDFDTATKNMYNKEQSENKITNSSIILSVMKLTKRSKIK
jgi:hypothetical protein